VDSTEDGTVATTQRTPGRSRRIVLGVPSMVGLTLAAFGYAAALTPSLLPRKLMFLLLLTALGALAGYAVGTTAWWALRKIPPLGRWQAPRLLRFGIPAIAWLVAFGFTPVAVSWQGEQQTALDMPSTLPGTVTLIVMTVLISTLLLLVGRLIRLGTNKVAGLITRIGPIHRWVSGQQPSRVHRSIAVVRACVAVAVIVLAAIGLRVGISALISSYDSVNANMEGQEPTNLGLNSGSPESYAPWETLGREGRFYVANTMTPAAIGEITGRPAQTPVRVYVGMEQGDTPDARTELAVKELDRVGAWDREYLVIFGVTGTGWVDPNAINALEAVTEGDVTTVAVQYSAVPSWIGFVIDPQTTIDQNRSMIDGVLAAWRAQPADQRPELILFGQSLGAMGTQGAWDASDTPVDVTAEIPHVIWMGPPAAAVLWKTWQADRTSGPAWDPVVGDGSIVRVLVSSGDTSKGPKPAPTIVFAAHANDPVVYWSPDLLLSKPDWLEPPLGPGVAPEMQWYPLVTFLQVGMDLIGGGEPPEVGHNYSANMAPAITLAVSPDGWTQENTERLQAALPDLRYATG
jgi:uncharacterized membrane protein